jgi:uncharacterized protein (DUF736 family)
MEKTEALGRGYIALNSKRKSENAPTHKGKLTIGDKKFDVSGWETTNDEGSTYIKFSLSEPWMKAEAKPAPKQDAPFDDEVPF